MSRQTKILMTLLALAATVVVGCGGDDANDNTTPATTTSTTETTPAPSGAATNLKLAADPSGALKFDKPKLSAKAGKVTITMDNPSSVQHAVSIEGNGVDEDGKTVGKGGVSTVSANLKAGTYTFYCPVPGHEDAGMKGTLTVK